MFTAATASAPAALGGRATAAISVTFGVSFAMRSPGHSFRTAETTASVSRGSAPIRRQPECTFGQETFSSRPTRPSQPVAKASLQSPAESPGELHVLGHGESADAQDDWAGKGGAWAAGLG